MSSEMSRAWIVWIALAAAMPRAAADGLDARLAAMEDRAAIEQLVTGDYPRALDQRRWPEYAALFTSDGELSFRDQTLKGPAAIEKYFSTVRLRPNSPPPRPGEVRTLHVVTNLSFKIEGDTAVGGAYWETIGVADGRTTVLSAGHYEDVLRKEQGQWKFAKRLIASDLAPPSTPAPNR
jgi:hypothetical protein